MKKTILLLYAILLYSTTMVGQTYYMTAPEGFGAAATGGGNATPVTVSTYSAFKTAWTSSGAAVILVSGTIDFSSSGMIKAVISNKTLIGLPGAKFVNTNQSVSGILYLSKNSNNVIIRNMVFEGPGAWDNNGNDNLTSECTNLWVDHCEFQDGEDGNFDNKGACDNTTISWCKFSYHKAPRPHGSGTTDDHRFSGLVGSSGSDAPSDGHYSITFTNCYWADTAMERMPRGRNAELHIVNCYYNTLKNSYVNGGKSIAIGLGGGNNNTTCYVENCDFASIGTVYKDYTSTDGGTVAINFANCLNGVSNIGTVSKPSYSYTVYPATQVAGAVANASCGAGATLQVTSAGVISASPCSTSSNTPPTVSLTAPANNASSCQGAAITLTATASDADGSISQVAFYDGTTLFATVTSSPYTYSWTTATSGSHTITAKATDNGGAFTTSSSVSITVNALPSAPTVTSPITYCQSATASALTATGTSLKWYTTSTGGTGSATAPTPSTTSTGTTSYYVSQTNSSNCESQRATIAVTVNATPSVPAVTSSVTYCQSAAASALTATGISLKWYTTSTGGTGSVTAPMPSTTSTGTTSYYVSQTNSSNCESQRATIAVTVNATPSAPTVTSSVTYCQGSTVAALTATGTALEWYSAATGGTGNTTAPTPSTTTVGTTDYYVTQTINNCESPRIAISVTISPKPSAPTVASPVTYCQNTSASALTASGTSLKWYAASTGGTGNTTAPTPSTANGGTTNYYVSQTNSSNCESPRATIVVTVNSTPTTSYAGTNQYVTITATNLNANTPSSGTGSWSVLSGTGSFNNSSSATTSVSGLSQGANVFEWTISNGVCAASISSVTITVGNSPVQQTISGPATIATNATGVTYSVPDDAGSHYLWSLPAGAAITSHNADSSLITVDFGSTGGTLSVTETNPYGSATSSLPISIGNAPVQQTITGDTSVIANQTGVTYSISDNSGSAYHWTLPSGATITSANTDSSQITVDFGSIGGLVSVTETNPYGSATSSSSISISSATAIIAATRPGSYILYPNPFSETATLIINSKNKEVATITIADVNGVIVYSASGYTNNTISIGNGFASGVYFVQVALKNEVTVLKLVKL